MDATTTVPPRPKKKFSTLRKRWLFSARHWIARHGLGSLPDFFIVGGQRCGTTSLHQYLVNHPRVMRALSKEIHYFDYNYHRGLAWYQAFFPIRHHPHWNGLRARPRWVCDASPYYMFHPHAPRRIAEVLPHTRLIALVRNPIDRAFSQYQLMSRKKVEKLSFEQALLREEKELPGEESRMLADENHYSYLHHKFSYLNRGIYHRQIRRLLEHFPREQLLVIRSEDLFANPESEVERTLDFLGLEKAQWTARSFPKRAASSGSTPMSRRTREFLIEYFRPHNAELETLLGRDFGWNA